MATNEKRYEIVFTKECQKEISDIFRCISLSIYTKDFSKTLMKKIEKRINILSKYPNIYCVVKKYKELELEYRRIIVDNYVILYTISERTKIIYVSHMFYSKSNYFNKF